MAGALVTMTSTKYNDAGACVIFCQCHGARGQIMCEVRQGKLTIERRWHGEQHYVILGPDILDELGEPRRIVCMCCAPEDALNMAQCGEDLLLIRTTRHQQGHFVALSRFTLASLLACDRPEA